jgi:hypothetical protein
LYVDSERFLEDRLVLLNMDVFDLILGMDWLSKYQAIIDCHSRRVVITLPTGDKVSFVCRSLVSYPRTFMSPKEQKDFVGWLSSIVDVGNVRQTPYEIPVVREFIDVFPDELPGIPPQREIDFTIELQSNVQPISIAPYRLAPAELTELKTQLDDLLT